MELEQTWRETNVFLEQILLHTKDLRDKVTPLATVSETAFRAACALRQIDIAEKELAEALSLSKSAYNRLHDLSNMGSIQDGQRSV